MVDFARRLAGLLVALALAAGLPLAAARAGCLCDHAHAHGAPPPRATTAPAACTAATCPMHRRAAGATHTGSAARDGMRCSCSGDAQALIGHATTIAILPVAGAVDRAVVRASRRSPRGNRRAQPAALAPRAAAARLIPRRSPGRRVSAQAAACVARRLVVDVAFAGWITCVG